MSRLNEFKDFIINKLEPEFNLKRDIINCKNEVKLIDLLPDKFNELQKEFSDEWDKDYLFSQFTYTTDFIRVAKKFIHTQPLFYDASKIWWIWNFKTSSWKKVDETDIMNRIDKYTNVPTAKATMKNELLEALKRVGRNNKPKNMKPTWIQFKHKIIDIENEKIFDADPKYFVTNPIPFDLGESDETPIMDKIFEEWVGKDYVHTLYEIISYCLIPSYPLHRMFCLIGEGMNGKSKYLELISRFVGTQNITTTELDTLLDSRFEIGRLHKKLVCLVGETNFNEMKKTSILKKLTGGDLIGFEYKGKDLFEDYNYAKIIISTNNLPTTNDKTLGFYRRWTIIDFPNRFSEKKDILGDIPEEEYSNLARKSIPILKQLLKNRKFHNEGDVEARMKKFEDLSNPFDKFMKENVVEDFDSEIPKFEFRQRLDDWCIDNRFRKITDSFLGKKMKELGITTIQKSAEWHNNEGKKPVWRYWSGINWKNLSSLQNGQPSKPSNSGVLQTSQTSHLNLLSPYKGELSRTTCEVREGCEKMSESFNKDDKNILFNCEKCDMKGLRRDEMFSDKVCKICEEVIK